MAGCSAEDELRKQNDDPEYKNWAKVGHAVNVANGVARVLAHETMKQLRKRIFASGGELAQRDPPLPPSCDCGQQYDDAKGAAFDKYTSKGRAKVLVHRAPKAGSGYTLGPATAFYNANPLNPNGSASIIIDDIDQATGAVVRASFSGPPPPNWRSGRKLDLKQPGQSDGAATAVLARCVCEDIAWTISGHCRQVAAPSGTKPRHTIGGQNKLWGQSDQARWACPAKGPWELARLFSKIGPDFAMRCRTADESDATFVCNLMLNVDEFEVQLGADFPDFETRTEGLLHARNDDFGHVPNQRIDAARMQAAVKACRDFVALPCLAAAAGAAAVDRATKQLDKLSDPDFELEPAMLLRLREDHAKIQQEKAQLEAENAKLKGERDAAVAAADSKEAEDLFALLMKDGYVATVHDDDNFVASRHTAIESNIKGACKAAVKRWGQLGPAVQYAEFWANVDFDQQASALWNLLLTATSGNESFVYRLDFARICCWSWINSGVTAFHTPPILSTLQSAGVLGHQKFRGLISAEQAEKLLSPGEIILRCSTAWFNNSHVVLSGMLSGSGRDVWHCMLQVPAVYPASEDDYVGLSQLLGDAAFDQDRAGDKLEDVPFSISKPTTAGAPRINPKYSRVLPPQRLRAVRGRTKYFRSFDDLLSAAEQSS